MKNRDYLKVIVKNKDDSITTLENFGFEVNVDFFSDAKSLGVVKLQRSRVQSIERISKLLYINWNNADRCQFAPANTEETSVNFEFPVILLIWISSTGNLNVIMDGKYMSPESGCNVDVWSDVNRVKVTLFDMRSNDRTTQQYFEINYEMYQKISKSRSIKS